MTMEEVGGHTSARIPLDLCVLWPYLELGRTGHFRHYPVEPTLWLSFRAVEALVMTPKNDTLWMS